MHYVKNKRDKVGHCNICTNSCSLSWDHVPPKGSIEISTVEMRVLYKTLAGKNEDLKIEESQNGLKFRTICRKCNEFLGHNYDPVIKDFAISVGRYLKSNLTFPNIIHHRTKPVKLMRGILGHILSAKVDFDKVQLDEQVRGFIFDKNAIIPDDIHIFYWIYPYDYTIILRDVVMPSVRGDFSNSGFFQIFKYFPIAYIITNLKTYEGLNELTIYRHLSIDEEVDIPIQLNRTEHYHWPEMVDNGNIVLAGPSASNAVFSVPKRRT
ncbi:MAG: hypothetical protein KGJ87_08130 [Planctomycetota bacterium]|nr:hypothetical protein [Planctomycetota bacterium]MDE1890503.1 hypothetical protein [Planctomycetota bacterium]MDE2217108.1 hypothetical protein [Planctomycetota bacterium]